MKATFAPDTNFFLQFKPASDVPWGDITPATEVELVVLLAVLRELDKHNHGPNGRRSRAAQRVLKTIRNLEPGKEVVLREHSPRVVFRELDPVEPLATVPSWIDTSKADEAMLVEILEYRAGGADDLQLLTADQALVRVARRAGLPAILPPDDWKLPPEPDPNEKRVADLERRLVAVEGRAPSIRVWPELGEREVQEIVGTVPRFRPLSAAFIERALQAAQITHPPASLPQGTAAIFGQRALDKHEQDRNIWLERLLAVLTTLHERLNFQQSVLSLTLCLENSGEAIATGFDVEVDAEGHFDFVDGDADAVERAREPFDLPTPPLLHPTGYEVFLNTRDLPHPSIMMPFKAAFSPRPDSPEFHWVHAEMVGQRIKGTCGQFRRARRPECLELDLLVPHTQEIEREVRGRVLGWFTADNLPKQSEFSFPVRIAMDWHDTEAAAVQLLAEKLQVEL